MVNDEKVKEENEEEIDESKEFVVGPKKMFKIFVALQGLPPGLMMDPMGDDILLSLRSRTPIKKSPDLSIKDEAKKKVIIRNGQIGFPADNLFACLMIAGRKVKVGRAQLSTVTTSTIPGFLAVEQDFIPLLHPDTLKPLTDNDWSPDMRRAVLQKDKIPVCNIRPKFSQWLALLSVKLNASEQDPSVVLELFRKAGNSVGLCSYRPDCKGRFGRFKVAGWKEVEIPDDETVGIDFFEEHPDKLKEL